MKSLAPFASALAGIILVLRAVSPASAGPAECEAIMNSFAAVAATPGYKQSVSVAEPKTEIEQIVIGEMLYTNAGGSWSKLKLKPGGRKGILDAIMSMSSVSECKEIRVENLPAGRMKVYEYMMAPPKLLPGSSTAPVKHEVWLGSSDGLVHRISAAGTIANITYGALTPPIP
ncbi:MAG: hypothetical protein LCH38_12365 [Proteobacteria bacterium]|nr:hypothetical protein [Pseudomonadota bacterium]